MLFEIASLVTVQFVNLCRIADIVSEAPVPRCPIGSTAVGGGEFGAFAVGDMSVNVEKVGAPRVTQRDAFAGRFLGHIAVVAQVASAVAVSHEEKFGRKLDHIQLRVSRLLGLSAAVKGVADGNGTEEKIIFADKSLCRQSVKFVK